jgi:soluble lytic murein transglycosylase-like protein
MRRRVAISACLCFGTAVLCIATANAQIAKVTDETNGRHFFINSEPPAAPASATKPKLSLKSATAGKAATADASHATIYLPAESSFAGRERPALRIDRDGVEKLVREAAERHRIDPALVRAVIETESNWNAAAVSRKGAFGLMQLIPTTAQRYGVSDAFNPQQNVDAGVRYLKSLLERYNGNLDLALAAYNAGEGAVDRAHGVPFFSETRNYIQKVQNAYFRPGSGRIEGLWINPHAVRKEVNADGRIIFTND